MKARAKEYLNWLAQQACVACGQYGVELAHIKGCVSAKTGLELPRRKGAARMYAICLCPACHRTGTGSIHNIGEHKFFERLGKNPHQLVATFFCRFFTEAA